MNRQVMQETQVNKAVFRLQIIKASFYFCQPLCQMNLFPNLNQPAVMGFFNIIL